MSVARRFARFVPARARVFLKKRFPKLIYYVAIELDSIPQRRLIPFATRRGSSLRVEQVQRRSRRLSSTMLSGFTCEAISKLEQLKFLNSGGRRGQAIVAWHLAKCYAYNKDFKSALDNLILAEMANPKICKTTQFNLMMVECLLQADRPHDAQRWLNSHPIARSKPPTEVYLTKANILHKVACHEGDGAAVDSERLEQLNTVYKKAGFSEVGKVDDSRSLSLDNITVPRPHPTESSSKLSVLMPAYNCADTLPISLGSILSQTWQNFELIIVDDQSQDDTWAIVQKYAALDNRIIPVQHATNGGAYAARNTALAHATGDFVTVHDADDWSHPEKFAAQMHYALSRPDGISTTTGVRVSHDLYFHTNAGAGVMLVQNLSSLLMKRETLVSLGGWDRTRVAADSELYERIRAKYGLSQNILFKDTPLTLILQSASSLTQTSATGLSTLYYGARRQYREAYRFWHMTERTKREPDFRMTNTRRFPAPRIVIGRKEPIADIDVLTVGNFSDETQSLGRRIALWEMLAKNDLKPAIAHWPTFETAAVDIVPSVRSAISTGLVEKIVPGETVLCKAVVALDAQLVDTPPDVLPQIRAEHLYVLSDTALSGSQEDAFTRLFGSPPVVVDEASLMPMLTRLRRLPLAGEPPSPPSKAEVNSNCQEELQA